MKSFFKSLTQKGYALYERGGRIAGIQGEKRRYRLSTLGYSEDRLINLNLKTKEQKRSAELEHLRKKGREHNKHKNR